MPMEPFAGDNDHGNHEIDYYGGCHAHAMVLGFSGKLAKYLCLPDLTNIEESQFSCSITCLGQTYTCVMIVCI